MIGWTALRGAPTLHPPLRPTVVRANYSDEAPAGRGEGVRPPVGSGQAREEAGGVAALHPGQLGGVIVTYAEADAATGRTAIDAAVRAFTEDSWRLDPMARATALSHLADAYTARMDEVVDTLCQENGKLRREAGFEAHFIPRAFRFAAGLALTPHGRVTDTQPGRQSMSIRQPVGLAGIVVPWNSPAYLCIRALAPALAARCTAVVKMPGQAARTAAPAPSSPASSA